MKYKHYLIIASAILLFAIVPSAMGKILFISNNTQAETAVIKLLLQEINYPAYAPWMEDAIARRAASGYSYFEQTEFYLDETEIPDFTNLLSERMNELGLSPDDPADKGFTDFLSGLGYEVDRSETTITEEPDGEGGFITTITQEFETELTPELINRLESYELIIMSRDIGSGWAYSTAGSGAEGAIERIRSWNGLSVPILTLNPNIITGSEWDYRWGWTYGYNRENPDTVTKFNADRGGLLDPLTLLQEVWEPEDPFLAGVEIPEDYQIDIYLDGVFRPSCHRKFSNNENFEFGAAVTNILEYVIPNFQAMTPQGLLDIETTDPVLLHFAPDEVLFVLEAPFTKSYFSGLSNQDIAQTLGEERIYFAAGLHSHGIFALNSTGKTILENIAGTYATPTVIPVESLWKDIAPVNQEGGKLAGIGWINDSSYPYVWHFSTNGYLYILHDFSSLGSIYLYDFGSQAWIWTNDTWGGWYYSYKTGQFAQW